MAIVLFSHYKSIETLSCHSNESTRATSTRNVTFVEATNVNISAKFQLHTPYGFWDDFEKLLANLAFLLPWQPIKFSGLDKIHIFDIGLLKEQFCKTFVKLPAG